MIRLLASVAAALSTLIFGIGLGGAMNARSIDAASAYAATSTAWVTSTAVVAPTTDRRTAQVTATRTATSTAVSTAHVAVTQLNTVTPTPRTAETPDNTVTNQRSYSNCSEARADGAAPLHRGEPGYSRKLDRDGDGIACEAK